MLKAIGHEISRYYSQIFDESGLKPTWKTVDLTTESLSSRERIWGSKQKRVRLLLDPAGWETSK